MKPSEAKELEEMVAGWVELQTAYLKGGQHQTFKVPIEQLRAFLARHSGGEAAESEKPDEERQWLGRVLTEASRAAAELPSWARRYQP